MQSENELPDPTPDRGGRRWFGLPSGSDVPPDVRREMEAARRDPGPGWREWFLFQGAKWWLGLAFLTVDTWIVVGAISTGAAVAAALLAIAVYLEILTYEYLWHRPEGVSPRTPVPTHWRWIRPVPVGRWTPEAEQIRRGHAISGASDGAPDPREFL
jgi:hypothetical protein